MSIDYIVHRDSGQPSISHVTIGYTYDEATDTLNDGMTVWSR